MSLSWITAGDTPRLPAVVAADEQFAAFPPVTCELSSFEPTSGTLHLSAYRLVFLESRRKTQKIDSIPLQQLVIPLHRWLQPTIGQPWFGPNYYEGEVRPTPGGGLQLAGGIILRAKFIFKEGGIEHFHKALEAAFAAARERQRNRAAGAPEDDLPPYEFAGEGNGVPPTYE